MKKNFYISLTKNEFSFNHKRNYNKKTALTFDVIPVSSSNNFIYQIEIEDNYFKSKHQNQKYQSDDKSKSRYVIDTGSYFIFTNKSDFFEQMEIHKYEHFAYKDVQNEYGVCTIPKSYFFGKQFSNISALGGQYGHGGLKVLGNQILSAFDIYFEKSRDLKVRKVSFVPIDENIYRKYRIENDRYVSFGPETFGFRTNNDGLVLYKVYFKNKEILPELKKGDKILFINENSYSDILEYEYPDEVILTVDRNKELKKIKAKRIRIEDYL